MWLSSQTPQSSHHPKAITLHSDNIYHRGSNFSILQFNKPDVSGKRKNANIKLCVMVEMGAQGDGHGEGGSGSGGDSEEKNERNMRIENAEKKREKGR